MGANGSEENEGQKTRVRSCLLPLFASRGKRQDLTPLFALFGNKSRPDPTPRGNKPRPDPIPCGRKTLIWEAGVMHEAGGLSFVPVIESRGKRQDPIPLPSHQSAAD